MKRGTIKFYAPDRGYGFIQPDEIGQLDVYLSKAVLQWAGLETIERGQKVTFELSNNSRNGRAAAREIKIAEPEA